MTNGLEPAAYVVDQTRLRYVTEHFHRLQGLTSVALGAMFLLLRLVQLDAYSLPSWFVWLVAGSLGLAQLFLPRYYQWRFGQVEAKSPTNRQVLIAFLIFLVLIFFGRPVQAFMGWTATTVGNHIHLVISDPAHRVNLYPLFFGSLALCASLARRPQRIDCRTAYFLSAGLLVWAVAALYQIGHPDIARLMIWRALTTGWGWYGITFMAWGLYNHITLALLLPKRVGEDEHE